MVCDDHSNIPSIEYHHTGEGFNPVSYVLLFIVLLLMTSVSYAGINELIIDKCDTLYGWKSGGDAELKLGLSYKHVIEGKASLHLHVKIDHVHIGKHVKNPIGWPSATKIYSPSISLAGYDFLQFDIFFKSLKGINPDEAISMIAKDSAGKVLYRTTFINLRDNQWTHEKLCIRDIPSINNFSQLHFYLNESCYNHNDIVDFYIDNIRATKAKNYHPPKAYSTEELVLKTKDLILWSEGSCRKIMRTENVRLSGRSRAFLEMSAARNETEAVQLVIRPLKNGGVGTVYLKIDELSGPNGSNISPENISWSPVYYVPANEGPPEGLPDGLPGPKCFVADKKWNYPIWIEVYVPKGTLPGDYRGIITVHTGIGSFQTELKLHVWRFSLPTKQSLRTSTVIYGPYGWRNEIKKWFGDMDYNQYLLKLRPSIVNMLAKYRLSPNVLEYLPLKYSEKDHKVIICSTNKFEQKVNLDLNKGLRINNMPIPYFFNRDSFLGAKKGTKEYLKRIFDAYRISAEYLQNKGWLNGSYVYCVDEVVEHRKRYFNQLDMLDKVFDTIRSANTNIKIFGTEIPSPIIRPMDIWCINMKNFDIDVLKEQHELGKKVWWYNGFQFPRPGMAIAERAVDHRALFWITYKYNIDGYLIWTVNRWVTNPWKKPNRNKETAAGNHFLLYPNPNGTVSPSIRLSIIRDGIEDYEYLHLLADAIMKLHAIRNESLANECEKTLKLSDSFILAYDNCSYIQPNFIYDSRRLIAEQLDKIWPIICNISTN